MKKSIQIVIRCEHDGSQESKLAAFTYIAETSLCACIDDDIKMYDNYAEGVIPLTEDMLGCMLCSAGPSDLSDELTKAD